jgi:putative membrane protein insertion efficiency factor
VKALSLVVHALFPSHGVAGAPTCKYHPSCSQYASDALRAYGPVRGSLKAAWRILRCNPWSRGGVDYA